MSSATSVTTPGVVTNATRSTFVVMAVWLGSAGTFVSITDTFTNTWTQIQTPLVLPANQAQRCYYVENGLGGVGHTFTWTVSGASPITFLVVEIVGGLTSGILHASDRQADTTDPYSTPNLVTTIQDCLLLAWTGGEGGGANPTTIDENTGFASVFPGELDGVNFFPASAFTKFQPNPATVAANFNYIPTSATDDAGCWIMAFRAAVPQARMKGLLPIQQLEPDEGDFHSELKGKNWFRIPVGLTEPHGA